MDKEINPATGYPDTGHFGGAPPKAENEKTQKEKPEKEKPIE